MMESQAFYIFIQFLSIAQLVFIVITLLVLIRTLFYLGTLFKMRIARLKARENDPAASLTQNILASTLETVNEETAAALGTDSDAADAAKEQPDSDENK